MLHTIPIAQVLSIVGANAVTKTPHWGHELLCHPQDRTSMASEVDFRIHREIAGLHCVRSSMFAFRLILTISAWKQRRVAVIALGSLDSWRRVLPRLCHPCAEKPSHGSADAGRHDGRAEMQASFTCTAQKLTPCQSMVGNALSSSISFQLKTKGNLHAAPRCTKWIVPYRLPTILGSRFRPPAAEPGSGRSQLIYPA